MNKDNQPKKTEQSAKTGKKSGKGRRVGQTIGIVLGTILLVTVLTSAIFVGIFMTYVNTSLKGHVEVDMSEYDQKVSTELYYQDPDTKELVMYQTLFGDENRIWVDFDSIPKNLRNATIAIEDKRFESHHGVDWHGTVRAVFRTLTNGNTQGGSTITQQLIKNVTGNNENTVKRKVTEVYRALALEKDYSKDEILEMYLNTIYLGNQCYGVQTASRTYFHKDVSELTLAECACLISITNNPSQYDPLRSDWTREQNRNRQLDVLDAMLAQEKIDQATYDAAKAEEVVFTNGYTNLGNYVGPQEEDEKPAVVSTANNSYFTDALFNEVVQDIMTKEGISESEAQKLLYTGGFTIEATVNTKLQSQMENLMLNTDDAYFPAGWHEEEVTSISDDDVQVFNEDGTPKTRTGEDGTVYYYRNVRTQAAMVTLDYDGNVLAIAGGLGEKTKSLSLNRAYNVERQTGSTIKPIGAYALGIEYGLVNWSTMLNNSPLYQKQDMIIRDEDYCRKNGLMGLSDKQLRAYPNAWRSWPRNYGGNYGDGSDLPLWNGLARSLNTIAVRVGDLVGASNIFNFVYNTLQLNTLDPTNDVGLAQMVMGSQTKGVTPMALAAAFQIFYDGEYTTPHLYTRVLDREGNIYLENNATSYQALTPDTAYVMNRLLKNVLFSSVGTASGRYPNSNGMEAFGKTGTASDEKDLWFVGGTPYYVTAVWWGYDAPYDMTKTLSKQQAKTRTCVTAWKALMEQAQADLPYKAFPTSAGVVERRYCTQSGLLAGAGCPSTAVGYYRADDLPDTCTYSHAAPQAAAPAENTDDAVPTQPVTPTDTSALDTE